MRGLRRGLNPECKRAGNSALKGRSFTKGNGPARFIRGRMFACVDAGATIRYRVVRCGGRIGASIGQWRIRDVGRYLGPGADAAADLYGRRLCVAGDVCGAAVDGFGGEEVAKSRS